MEEIAYDSSDCEKVKSGSSFVLFPGKIFAYVGVLISNNPVRKVIAISGHN